MPDVVTGNVIDVYPFSIANGTAHYVTLMRTPTLPFGDTWQAVHGRIDKRETAVQAVAREVLAQTGIDPISLWNIDYVNNFYVPEEDALYLVPSIAAQLPPSAVVQLSPEHVNWDWVSPEIAVQRFLWMGQRLAIQTLHEEIAAALARGRQPNPYLLIDPGLYEHPRKGRR